jgi:hypothetical protein
MVVSNFDCKLCKYIDYIFLGDYADQRQHNLETISLLLAFKVIVACTLLR